MCLKGSLRFRTTRNTGGYWYVSWYEGKKEIIISRYNGFICRSKEMAMQLLAEMRGDWKRLGNINRFLFQSTDISPFLDNWLATQTHLSPATKKDYANSIKNHLKPWFAEKRIMLHEVQYDVLRQLLAEMEREGKGKLNAMYCLHEALVYAHKAGKIQSMPSFPERRHYGIEEKKLEVVTEARQIAIIKAIPVEHQPIFWWLKYHFRRPSEAMALHKEDYDRERDCFIIRRSFSNKQLVQHTKTHKIHEIPNHPYFAPWLSRLHLCLSPFFFTHETSRMPGKRYQHDFLVDLWNKAAAACGETISLYKGTKHSSCTAFVNEQGGSIDELQMMTDHARRDSVMKYTDVQLAAKRRIQGKVVSAQTWHKHKENGSVND